GASRAGSSSRSCASAAAPTRRGFSSPARRRRRAAASISTARPSISPRGCRCSTRWKPPAAATASGRCKSKALASWRCARARRAGRARMGHGETAPAMRGCRADGPAPGLRLQRGNGLHQHLPARRGAGASRLRFRVSHLLDLTHHEQHGRFLEGTGSLVLDHRQRVAYACASPRTHPGLVAEWARELKYEPVIFHATDRAGAPLYHTNVLMSIGERLGVVATSAIAPGDRERVLARLRASEREILEIGVDEIERFAGNMLELGTWDEALGDSRVVVMSETARRSLSHDAFAQLSGCTDSVLSIPVPTIERLGGGSVRCMMAEVFRPA